MKVYKIILLFGLLLMACSKESVKSDIFVNEKYSIQSAKSFSIGKFEIRTNVPYVTLNYREQVEYHLQKQKYKVYPGERVDKYYKEKKIKFPRLLKEEEIQGLHGELPFDYFIQGIIYEENRSILDEGNHIIVHLYFHDKKGEKASTIRYIYSGDKSLISGELIDESILKMLSLMSSQSSRK